MGLFNDITDAFGITSHGATQAGKEAAQFAHDSSRELSSKIGADRGRFLERFNKERDYLRDFQDPMKQAGLTGLGAMERGSTTEGFLGNINALANDPNLLAMIEKENAYRARGATNQLAAGGLTRSGAAAHAGAEATMTPQEYAMQIEPQLYGRSSGLASMLENPAFHQMLVPNTSPYDMAQAEVLMAGDKGTMEGNLLKEQGRSDTLAGWGDLVKQGVGGYMTGGASGAFGAMLSDVRLKTNIVELARIGGLPLCSWDWIEGVEGLPGAEMHVGFIAQDIQKVYPQATQQVDDMLWVDYDRLHELMEAA